MALYIPFVYFCRVIHGGSNNQLCFFSMQIDVRWNSYLGMIQRVVLLREAINRFVKWYAETGGPSRFDEDTGDDDYDFKHFEFSETDWVDLKFLCNILEPYRKAS